MKFHGYFEEAERHHRSGIPYKEHLIEAQAGYSCDLKGKAFQFTDCWLKIRHLEKFMSLEETMKQQKSPNKSTTLSEQHLAQNQTPSDLSLPPAKRDRPLS